MDRNAQDPPQSSSEGALTDATTLSTICAPTASQAFRVDELALARLVDQGFEKGHQALGRLRAALELLERSEKECRTDVSTSMEAMEGMEGMEGKASANRPGDVYSMMLAIERQTDRVERRLETLSSEALRIVSSALVEVDGGIDDRVGDGVGGHQSGKTPVDGAWPEVNGQSNHKSNTTL